MSTVRPEGPRADGGVRLLPGGAARRAERLCQGAVALALLVLASPWARAAWVHRGGRGLYVLAVSAAFAYVGTPIVRVIALRFGVLDAPGPRKVHAEPTPLLGGVPIYLAFVGGVLFNGLFTPPLLAVLAGATLLAAVGVVDDVRGVRARTRLALQLVATGFLLWSGARLTLLPGQLLGNLPNLALTVLWVVGITSAMNFFDGMDGLAAGLSAIMGTFIGIVAVQTRQPYLGWLAAGLVGGCLGFLPYNFRPAGPARIFLGEVGSTVLGYTLACLGVIGDWSERSLLVSAATPIFIFGVLIYDMVHITVDRIARGDVRSVRAWIEYVGRDHLHHRMAALLGSPRLSVLFIYCLSVCLGLTALVLRGAEARDAAVLLLQAVMIVLIVTVLEREGNRRLPR
jgi:UDP-GlcNAc:undecaprenyl-phosphate GlcNAc-1-phosphate transferase